MKGKFWKIFGEKNDFDFWADLLLNGRIVLGEEFLRKHKSPPEKIVPQNYDYDCGFGMFCTGMLMIGRDDVLKTDLYSRLRVNPVDGTRSEDIKKVLEEEGVPYVEMVDTDLMILEALVVAGCPVFVSYQSEGSDEEIKNLECGHYSIVFDIDEEFVWLIDPSYDMEWEPGFGKGVVRVLRSDFLKKWIDKGTDGTIYDKWLIALRGKTDEK